MEANGEPVLLLGYDVGPYEEPNPDLGERRKRWRQVFGDKSALLPLIMVQSGAEVTQGRHKSFHDKYLSMIRSAQQKKPTAQLSASLKRSDQTLTASIQLRNMGETLSEKNKASVRLFFYDDATTIHLAHTPRIIETIPLIEPVSTDQEVSFRLTYNVPTEIDAASLHLAVIVEHLDSNGRWTIAQGTFAKVSSQESVASSQGEAGNSLVMARNE
jgi:hypothetical protein